MAAAVIEAVAIVLMVKEVLVFYKCHIIENVFYSFSGQLGSTVATSLGSSSMIPKNSLHSFLMAFMRTLTGFIINHTSNLRIQKGGLILLWLRRYVTIGSPASS